MPNPCHASRALSTALRGRPAGMAALAAAMGIGRFAFTPLLPMMLSDGVITSVDGSWLPRPTMSATCWGLDAWRCPG